MIQRPKWVKTFQLRFFALLPVNPPEINAVIFIWMVQNVKVRLDELHIRKVKFNRLFRVWINAVCLCHFFVLVFKETNAIFGVQIHCDGKPHTLQIFEKLFIVGEQFFVESISRPTGPLEGVRQLVCLLWNVLYKVPIHIYRGNRKGYVFLAEFAHQIEIFFL